MGHPRTAQPEVAARLRSGEEPFRRRRSTVITKRGQKALVEWLAEPVKHIRDARSLLLLKLVILDDLGLDPDALIESQLQMAKTIEGGLGLVAPSGSSRT